MLKPLNAFSSKKLETRQGKHERRGCISDIKFKLYINYYQSAKCYRWKLATTCYWRQSIGLSQTDGRTAKCAKKLQRLSKLKRKLQIKFFTNVCHYDACNEIMCAYTNTSCLNENKFKWNEKWLSDEKITNFYLEWGRSSGEPRSGAGVMIVDVAAVSGCRKFLRCSARSWDCCMHLLRTSGNASNWSWNNYIRIYFKKVPFWLTWILWSLSSSIANLSSKASCLVDISDTSSYTLFWV